MFEIYFNIFNGFIFYIFFDDINYNRRISIKARFIFPLIIPVLYIFYIKYKNL